MKIGEFAKLSSATIRTLRYYDDLGLLKPDRIDEYTGYRIYSSKKLEQMREIQAMKEIGFTLLEIKSFLAISDSDEKGKIDFIAGKREEIECERQKAETRLSALDELIVKIKEGGEKMENKNYCLPFCGMTDDEGLAERRKVHNEENSKAYSEMKTAPKFVKVCAYDTGFGAIAEDGTPYVWGGERNIADGLPPVVDFDLGYTHSVAIDVHGKLYGWGANIIPAIDFSDNLPRMISVKAHANKTVALSEDGKVFCWGEYNNSGQKDVPRNMGVVKQIAAGAYHTAALNSEGKVFSWGVFGNPPPPYDVEITAIAASDYDIACLGADGKVYGDLNCRELNKRFKPKPDMTNIKKISGGRDCFAAIDGDGKLYVWGECRKLADSNSIFNIPLNLPPVTDVAFGEHEIICLGEDGKLYGWGLLDVVVPPVFDGFKNEPIFEEADEMVDINIPRDVYTFDELCEAVREKIQNITIKADMTITGDSFYVVNDITLTVDEGVTVLVSCPNFFIQKKLINNGTIKGLTEQIWNSIFHGSIRVNNQIEGTGSIIIGNDVNQFGFLKGLGVDIIGVNTDEIGKYLAEDSIYTKVSYPSSQETVISIDYDLVIPKGKSLWLNQNCTLKVNEGVTLTIKGRLETFKDPIIDGTVVGEIYTHTPNSSAEVSTFEELCEAVPQKGNKPYTILNKITIKNDIIISDDMFAIIHNTPLVIDEGVTLTVNSCVFTVMGGIVNNGTLNGTGHIYTNVPITGTGSVNTSGGLRIDLYDAQSDELGQCLAEDSIYTEIIYTNMQIPQSKSVFLPKREESFITIDRDIVIPKGKSIWMHANCTLKVDEGVTLKIDGKIETFNEPIIEGTVIGDITLIDVDKPRDVYTFAEFYEAARNNINEITVKDNIIFAGTRHGPWINVNTMIIDKGVTLICDSCNLGIEKTLINNGRICGTGRVHIKSDIDGSGTTDISDGLEINVRANSADEIGEYLIEDSIYTQVSIMKKKDDEDNKVTIGSDLVIPKGKSLWLNVYCTLEVKEGVTLRIDGKVETYNEPIIEGTVIGDITLLDKLPF